MRKGGSMNLIEEIKKTHAADIENRKALIENRKALNKNLGEFTVQFCLYNHLDHPMIGLSIISGTELEAHTIYIADIYLTDEIDIHAAVDTNRLRRILERKLTSISI